MKNRYESKLLKLSILNNDNQSFYVSSHQVLVVDDRGMLVKELDNIIDARDYLCSKAEGYLSDKLNLELTEDKSCFLTPDSRICIFPIHPEYDENVKLVGFTQVIFDFRNLDTKKVRVKVTKDTLDELLSAVIELIDDKQKSKSESTTKNFQVVSYPDNVVVYFLNYATLLQSIHHIEEELQKEPCASEKRVIFDRLTYMGNASNRYADGVFDGKHIIKDSLQDVLIPKESELRKRSARFYKDKNLNNSILTESQKRIIKKGFVL